MPISSAELVTPVTSARRRFHGRAWIALTLSLAIHVADEAAHDFLALYNPIALHIRQSAPFLPVPVFTFQVWLLGLLAAIGVLLALSPFVFRAASWTPTASFIFGGAMLLNGCAHIAASIYSSHLQAGTYSAPLLIIASLALIYAASSASHVHRAGA